MTSEISTFLNDKGGPCGPLSHLGVALSGGSDSTALLLLCHDWALDVGAQLTAFTVDHGLRAEAADEARQAAALCHSYGIAHKTLIWTGWDGRGNVQDAARRARYRLLAVAAGAAGCEAVALGHTLDDQAETFLMRLARGSGVDGLAAMQSDWRADDMRWLRPLLTMRREALRGLLRLRDVRWSDDPSNSDTRFDRVKMRDAMPELERLGLDATRLTQTAQAMATARAALRHVAHEVAANICEVQAGDVVIQPEPLFALPKETRDRIVAQALRFVSSTPYRPRLDSLHRVIQMAEKGQTATLQGCLVFPHRSGLRISRELAAVADLTSCPDAVWDGRWRLDVDRGEQVPDGTEIRALGQGISQLEDWRASALPRPTVMSSPALWHQNRVIAAPFVQETGFCRLVTVPDTADFLASILSH